MGRFRLRTLLIVIAFVALGVALLVQELRTRTRIAELEAEVRAAKDETLRFQHRTYIEVLSRMIEQRAHSKKQVDAKAEASRMPAQGAEPESGAGDFDPPPL